MSNKLIAFIFFVVFAVSCNQGKNDVVVYPAPEGEALNTKFKVAVNGVDVPVYNARICTEDIQGRHKAGIVAEADKYFDLTGFASFDMKKGPVKVTVSILHYS